MTPSSGGSEPSSRTGGGTSGSPFVTLTFWRVPTARIPWATARMALDRPGLRRASGLRFAKLLGTSPTGAFGVRDVEPRRWALLTVWDTADDARRFEREGATHRRWAAVADERLRVDLRPSTSRGRWSGRAPFDPDVQPAEDRPIENLPPDGPVAAITRARLRATRARDFHRSVPAVARDLADRPGLLLALGIGEAPVGWQGTFSLWTGADALAGFAYRGAPHAAVVRRAPTARWYAEELFARFTVLAVEGTLDGRNPLAGRRSAEDRKTSANLNTTDGGPPPPGTEP